MCAQSCLSVCDPADCRPPGSSVCGISQARILEWITISSSRGSSQFTIKDILMRTDKKNPWRDNTGQSMEEGTWSFRFCCWGTLPSDLHGLITLPTFLNPRDFYVGFIMQEWLIKSLAVGVGSQPPVPPNSWEVYGWDGAENSNPLITWLVPQATSPHPEAFQEPQLISIQNDTSF